MVRFIGTSLAASWRPACRVTSLSCAENASPTSDAKATSTSNGSPAPDRRLATRPESYWIMVMRASPSSDLRPPLSSDPEESEWLQAARAGRHAELDRLLRR